MKDGTSPPEMLICPGHGPLMTVAEGKIIRSFDSFPKLRAFCGV
jgi:hypothetical protein